MRNPSTAKVLNGALIAVAVAMCIYQLVAARVIIYSPVQHQNTHLLFALLIVFLSSLRKKPGRWPLLLPLILLSIVATGYIWYFYPELEGRTAQMLSITELAIGLSLILVILEATRQSMGWVLPGVALAGIVYVFAGQYAPGMLWHFPISLQSVVQRFDMGLVGIYGTALNLSASFMFLFMVFGVLLRVTGASRLFIELGKWVGSKLAGGAGLTAVITSALVGTTTGWGTPITAPITIPFMKDSGYKPDVAAGIEAAASTGAGIMPPIMAMAAFALAAFVGIPYFKVMTMAIIPAILYFLCLGLFVQLFALKHNFKPLPAKLDTKVVIKTLPQFLIPVTVLLVLLMMGHSLAYTAFYTLVTLVIVSLLRKETRGSWRTWLEGATEGAILGGGLGVSCALIGIIISSVGITGLGIRLAGLIDILSGGSIWIALVLTALIVIILGCGLPPVASYLIVAMLGAPILIDMGIPLLPAHFFVFFFAVFAFITPPVGMSCVVAASVAGASYMKTAVQAMRVGIVGWFLPFLVILAPLVLMLPADLPLEIVKLIACLIIVLFLQVLLVGYYLTPLNFKERLMSAITAAALVGFVVVGNYFLLALGLIVGAYLSFNQWRKKRQLATTNSA